MISMPAVNIALSPWVAGSPGANLHRRSFPVFVAYSFTAIEAALDQIKACPVEREAAHTVARTDGTAAALRVIRRFREPDDYAGPQLNLW